MAPLEYFYSTPAPRAASRRLPGQTVDTAVLSDRPVPTHDFPRSMHENMHINHSTSRAQHHPSVSEPVLENVQHNRLVSAGLRGRAPLESDALVTSHSARPALALALGGGFSVGSPHFGG